MISTICKVRRMINWLLHFSFQGIKRYWIHPRDIIDNIPGYKHSNAFTNKQRLILEYAEAIKFLSEKIETLRESLTEKELVDLTASISLMGALNRLRITLGDRD